MFVSGHIFVTVMDAHLLIWYVQYAWFNGIDTKAMRKAEDVDIEGNENCVLGESYTGKPEWECS